MPRARSSENPGPRLRPLGGALLLAAVVACGYLLLFASDFRHTLARHRMVRGLAADEAEPVRDAAVLAAMRHVPRHRFARPADRGLAYANQPLLLDEDTTISQPYIVAYMLAQLRLGPDDRVLAINLGSGYEAAVLAGVAGEVYAVALSEGHASRAEPLLKELGYGNIQVRHGDGYAGWPEHAPYDALFVRAAVEEIPDAWTRQLKTGGRMVVPLGAAESLQSLVLVEKGAEGTSTQTHTMPVRFWPLPPAEGGALPGAPSF